MPGFLTGAFSAPLVEPDLESSGYVQDISGNAVWDGSQSSLQPMSIYSAPVRPTNTIEPSDVSSAASSIADVLVYGLNRAIDVQTIKALAPQNMMPVYSTNNGVPIPVYQSQTAGRNNGALMLLIIGAALLWGAH